MEDSVGAVVGRGEGQPNSILPDIDMEDSGEGFRRDGWLGGC